MFGHRNPGAADFTEDESVAFVHIKLVVCAADQAYVSGA
jgi:hypothetical protein